MFWRRTSLKSRFLPIPTTVLALILAGGLAEILAPGLTPASMATEQAEETGQRVASGTVKGSGGDLSKSQNDSLEKQSAALNHIADRLKPGPNWPAGPIAPAVADANAAPPAANPDRRREEALPFKYTGNTVSLKFHRPRCPFSRMMADCKKTRFHFRCQAVAGGYTPCRYCLPPIWTTVTAKIKCQDNDKFSVEQKCPDRSPVDFSRQAPPGSTQQGSNICRQ